MNKQTIITILLALVAVAGQAQVRYHVIGTVAEGTMPYNAPDSRNRSRKQTQRLRISGIRP